MKMKMKDIRYNAIAQVEKETGYDYSFLDRCIEELEDDGYTFDDALKEVREIALEGDY